MSIHNRQPGVIFDLDGTLIDTLDDITDSLNETFEAVGRSGVPRDRVRTLIGASRESEPRRNHLVH